jgi:hypothetical protein
MMMHGMTAKSIAARFGLPYYSIKNHLSKHMTPAAKAAIVLSVKPSEIDMQALCESEGQSLLANLIAQRARLAQAVEQALEGGDIKGAVSAERAVTDNLETVGKLLGAFVQHHEVRHTNLLISADYLRLRQAVVLALRPYPDAARAVGAALLNLEQEAADEITAKSERPMLEAVPC